MGEGSRKATARNPVSFEMLPATHTVRHPALQRATGANGPTMSQAGALLPPPPHRIPDPLGHITVPIFPLSYSHRPNLQRIPEHRLQTIIDIYKISAFKIADHHGHRIRVPLVLAHCEGVGRGGYVLGW